MPAYDYSPWNGVSYRTSLSHHHNSPSKKIKKISILLAHCIISLSLLSTHTLAQTLTVNSAYATVNEQTLYIQGGSDLQNGSGTNITQFYSLDLTQSWSSSSPPWKALSKVQAPQDYQHSMTVSQDQKRLYVWGSLTNFSTYDIAQDTWTTGPKPANTATNINGLRSVADPATGIIYIPAGGINGSILGYNPVTSWSQSYSPPTQLTSAVSHYGAAWSTSRRGAIMYGGLYQQNANVTLSGLYQFSSSSFNWAQITTATGDVPGPMSGHCLVSAYSGTKMILFGGQLADRTPLSDIYVLDVGSWVWKKGAALDPTLGRNGMACGVSGDYFVAWGGGRMRTFSQGLLTPVIYNIKTDQWTTQFGAGTSNPNSTNPSNPNNPNNPNDPNSNNGSGPSLPVIIGSAVGGVAVLGLIAFIIFRRIKSNGKQAKTYESINSDNGSNYTGSTGKRFSNEIGLQNIRLSVDHHASNTPAHYPPPASSQVTAPLFSQSAAYSRVDQYPDPLYPNNINPGFSSNLYISPEPPVSVNAFTNAQRPISSNSYASSQMSSANTFTNPYGQHSTNVSVAIPKIQTNLPTVQGVASPVSPVLPANKPRRNDPQLIVWNQEIPGEPIIIRGPQAYIPGDNHNQH